MLLTKANYLYLCVYISACAFYSPHYECFGHHKSWWQVEIFFLKPPLYPKIQDSFFYITQKYLKLERPDAIIKDFFFFMYSFFLISLHLHSLLLPLVKIKFCSKPAMSFGTSEIHPVKAWASVHRELGHGFFKKCVVRLPGVSHQNLLKL